MEIINYIFLVCILVLIAISVIMLRKSSTPEQQVSNIEYKKLMGILRETIQSEFSFRFKLYYELKDIKVIYKFEDDLKELVTAIMESFSMPFLEELKFYHSERYIIKYVTRTVQIMLMEYQKTAKIKTK